MAKMSISIAPTDDSMERIGLAENAIERLAEATKAVYVAFEEFKDAIGGMEVKLETKTID